MKYAKRIKAPVKKIRLIFHCASALKNYLHCGMHYPYPHAHIPIAGGGHATFDSMPDEETLGALQKMVDIARTKID